jgi:hypothetical protein
MTRCYRLSRTSEEVRAITHELPLPAVQQTKKTCLAFKILATGRRIGAPEQLERRHSGSPSLAADSEGLKTQEALPPAAEPRD